MDEAGERAVGVNVSAPVHSRYMNEFGEEFGEFLARYRFNDTRIPVISNVTSEPYKKGQVPELLTKQLSNSVRWTDSINYLLGMGVQDFEELGAGTVLTGLLRQIESKYEAVKTASEVS
jgi:malonyl CoA-acyl carrier protein transacylase